jgi:Holliday junction resolvasome RuvABC endonuclease subunit
MIKILSFDVSSVSTGWAFLKEGKLEQFGVIQPPDKYSIQEKLYWFKSEVSALFEIYRPNHVLVEETYLKNVKTLKTLMQFIGVINLECFYKLRLEPVFLSPNTVRSEFGLKTKRDVFKAVKLKYKSKFKKIEFEDGNDITDAIMQALYWWKLIKEKENAD